MIFNNFRHSGMDGEEEVWWGFEKQKGCSCFYTERWVEQEHYLIGQDNTIHKFSIEISVSSKGQNKSKLQKQKMFYMVKAFIHGAMGDGSSDRSFMVDPLSYFSFQPVLHDWCNKAHGMCYPDYGMMHIKEPLLLIRKSSPYGGSMFPFSVSEWFLTICLMPHNSK